MGLGPIIGKQIVILTTRGRKTGLLRNHPIGYLRDADVFYAVSTWGERADWYQNLQANPDAALQVGNLRIAVKAEFLTDTTDLEAAVSLVRQQYPNLVSFLKSLAGGDLDGEEGLQKLHAVRFVPTGASPEGEIPTDLVWVWGALAPLTVFVLMRRRARRRRRAKRKAARKMRTVAEETPETAEEALEAPKKLSRREKRRLKKKQEREERRRKRGPARLAVRLLQTAPVVVTLMRKLQKAAAPPSPAPSAEGDAGAKPTPPSGPSSMEMIEIASLAVSVMRKLFA
jgi:deazaflavin-dependent oxidoreductase (nitroreductase family)